MTDRETNLELYITGMSCISCAGQVENALRAVPGVSRAAVSLATSRAGVMYDPARVTTYDMVRAVEDVGYGVETAELMLDVRGMTCASCVAYVEGVLTDLEGVTGAVVNFRLRTVRVQYIPELTTAAQMTRALREAGYEVNERGVGEGARGSKRQSRQGEISRWQRNLIIAGVIGVPVMLGVFYDMFGPLQMVVPKWLTNPWVLGLLTTPIVFGAGRQFFTDSWRGLRHGAIDMNLLWAAGLSAAYGIAVINTVSPGAGLGGEGATFFGSAALLTFFLALGRWLETLTRSHTP